MQCITQEAPSNAATRHNIDRYMSRGSAAAARDRDRNFDDDFDLIRSGPPRYIYLHLHVPRLLPVCRQSTIQVEAI